MFVPFERVDVVAEDWIQCELLPAVPEDHLVLIR